MANGPAHRGPPRPGKLTGSPPSSRSVKEGSEPSLPGGGTYFLGRYRIVDEIGVGGMASVHLARADGPGGFQKWVAIKRIHRHLAEDETFIRMFLDEARIAARISHPNVAQVFDLGKHRDTYWIAMEYLHGEPLREVMRAVEESGAPRMGPALAAKIIADAAEGLHAAHELRDKNGKLLNLVHRDVTPHNLFLTYDGAVKVVDFGIAKVTGRLSNTRAGTLKGKLAYMSPEQVRGASVDRRTDVFALGVVLWELTTGRRLFRMESDLETLERVQACVVPPPSTVVENYPVELEAIVMRALAKDLSKRFPTAREMSRTLQQYLMRTGSFLSSDEIGAYVKQVLSDRFEKREAHLQWAAEVTQTISLDQLEGSPRELEDVSILTYASDVQEVAGRGGPRPAAGAPPRPPSVPSANAAPASHGVPPSVSQPRTIGGQPPVSPNVPPLPSYDMSKSGTTNSGLLEPFEDDEFDKTRVASPATHLGMGPSSPPRLPSWELSASAPSAPVMHDYSQDDEGDAVTRVMQAPSEADEVPTISTVHEPAKKAQPAPQPVENIVVAQEHVRSQYGIPPQQGYPGYPPPGMAAPYMMPAPRRDSRSLVIAIIAATTTLIALAMTALVVLKVTESPSAPAPTAVATAPTAAPTQPTATVAATAPTAPTPPIATAPTAAVTAKAAPTPTPQKAVSPSSLPQEKRSAARPTRVETPAAAPGYLTIVCDPACDSVIAGGRNLGPSPVVRRSLSAGTHAVTLRRSGAPTKSISVTIVSGQTTARRVTMGS
jgi:eukaryotic-like serine/threonine-protein kinase